MVTKTSASLAANITIWDPAMSGCSVTHSGWIVFMDGKEAMLIGGITPFAMTVTGRIAMDMSSQGVTTSGMNIDSHEKPTESYGNQMCIRDRLTNAGNSFTGNGAGLTSLSASAITGGTTTNILIGGHMFYYTNGVLMNVQ